MGKGGGGEGEKKRVDHQQDIDKKKEEKKSKYPPRPARHDAVIIVTPLHVNERIRNDTSTLRNMLCIDETKQHQPPRRLGL